MRQRTARSLAWLAGLALSTAPAAAAPAASAGETFTFSPFGTVHVYAPPGPSARVVLFVSGDGGWNLGVIPMARRLPTSTHNLFALVTAVYSRFR